MNANCTNGAVGTPWPFLDALEALAQRLNDVGLVHWTEDELQRYLKEALRTLSAFTQRYRDRGSFQSVIGQAFYDLPTVLPSLRGNTVTSTDLIIDIEYALMEPPNPAVWEGTEQFNLSLILESLNSRANQYQMETGAIVTAADITGVTVDANGRFTLPSNAMTIRRAAWEITNAPSAGTIVPLKREDEWAMTHYIQSWPQNPIAPNKTWPTGYSVGVTPPLVVQLAPAPTKPGTLHLLSVNTVAPLLSSPVLLGLPDDWAWVTKWGALAELLSRDGLAYDPQRAQYCEARWKQGITMALGASVVLNGAIDGQLVTLKSVVETDQYRRTWQTGVAAPKEILTTGQNIVGLKPRPDTTAYTVTLDVVRNVQVPVDLTDCVVVDEQMRDAFLDYAQHLAIFKEGPSQLEQAMGLFERFSRACGVTVALDQAAVPNRGPLMQQTRQDERIKDRIAEPEPTLP